MIYYVTFDTQKNRCTKDWIFHCEAKNAAEAVQTAKQAWTDKGNTSHQFHLHAGKSRFTDPEQLKVRAAETWTAVKAGDEVMNHFIALGSHFWH